VAFNELITAGKSGKAALELLEADAVNPLLTDLERKVVGRGRFAVSVGLAYLRQAFEELRGYELLRDRTARNEAAKGGEKGGSSDSLLRL
jgi:hypothetical protein